MATVSRIRRGNTAGKPAHQSAALPLPLPSTTYQDAGTKAMNPPRADLGQNLAGSVESSACFGLVITVLADQSSLFLSGTRVLGLGDADNMHHLIVGANGVLDDGLRLRVVDAALLIIATLRLAWVCLPLALDDVVVGRASLEGRSAQASTAADSVRNVPALAMSAARGGPWCSDRLCGASVER